LRTSGASWPAWRPSGRATVCSCSLRSASTPRCRSSCRPGPRAPRWCSRAGTTGCPGRRSRGCSSSARCRW